MVILAPLVEESSKGLFLFLIFFWKKDEFDGIVDGIVYAGMVALGFAMTENVKYYGEAMLQGTDTLLGTFILRGAMSPFAHPLFTSMTGIGLGWARQTSNRAVKILAPLFGLGLAMVLHGLWNLSALITSVQQNGLFFLVVYGGFMIPVFIATLVVLVFALRREGRIVRENLLSDYQSGTLTPEQYQQLCSIRGRMGASFRALTKGGFGVWRARMNFNQAASELAFHRSHVARGLITDAELAREREEGYRQALLDLRQRLGPH